jgi:hypothetical protein
MNTPVTKFCLPSFLALLLGLGACVSEHQRVGELRTESQSVKLGRANSVRVVLQLGSGELKVSGGAADLLEARFTYNVLERKPRVEYVERGDQGRLNVEEPSGTHNSTGDSKYNWDLRLNNGVPMDLSVNMGAGTSALNLGGLSLRTLDFNLGAGTAVVDLSGNWKQNFAAEMNGGAGSAIIKLPREVGVRVQASGGLGTIRAPGFKKEGGAYVNEAYGKSPITLRLEVHGGVGEINLEMAGTPPTV